MADHINVFSTGSRKQYLSSKEIEAMRKQMKKVPELQLKSEIYHSQEAAEAESILGNIPSEPIEKTSSPHSPQTQDTNSGFISLLIGIRQRFSSLWK